MTRSMFFHVFLYIHCHIILSNPASGITSFQKETESCLDILKDGVTWAGLFWSHLVHLFDKYLLSIYDFGYIIKLPGNFSQIPWPVFTLRPMEPTFIYFSSSSSNFDSYEDWKTTAPWCITNCVTIYYKLWGYQIKIIIANIYWVHSICQALFYVPYTYNMFNPHNNPRS